MQVDVNGTRLWFDVDGAALVPDGSTMSERPTVVLLHGGPGGYDHSYFKPDFTASTMPAQVVYLDLRDHGRSARHDPNDWTFELCADDVRAFCDTVGIVRPIVYGHSMGGFIAMLYAARHPDHAGALVLQSTCARFDLDRLVEGCPARRRRRRCGARPARLRRRLGVGRGVGEGLRRVRSSCPRRTADGAQDAEPRARPTWHGAAPAARHPGSAAPHRVSDARLCRRAGLGHARRCVARDRRRAQGRRRAARSDRRSRSFPVAGRTSRVRSKCSENSSLPRRVDEWRTVSSDTLRAWQAYSSCGHRTTRCSVAGWRRSSAISSWSSSP